AEGEGEPLVEPAQDLLHAVGGLPAGGEVPGEGFACRLRGEAGEVGPGRDGDHRVLPVFGSFRDARGVIPRIPREVPPGREAAKGREFLRRGALDAPPERHYLCSVRTRAACAARSIPPSARGARAPFRTAHAGP